MFYRDTAFVNMVHVVFAAESLLHVGEGSNSLEFAEVDPFFDPIAFTVDRGSSPRGDNPMVTLTILRKRRDAPRALDLSGRSEIWYTGCAPIAQSNNTK